MDTKQLKQKILDLAIRGKLVPQDPNDEPASVLLERIRKEKEQLIAAGKLKKSKSKTTDTPHYENVPFEIPDSWEWTRLGDISSYGQTIHTDVDSISSTDWVLELEDIEKETAHILQVLQRKDRQISGVRNYFKKGQILYSKLRTYLNKVLVAPQNGFCTTEIIPFSCYGTIEHRFIANVLRSQYFVDYTTLCCYGCKMPRFSTEDAQKGLIPLPPLPEQKRIADSIVQWFALIDEIEANKKDLQEYIKQAKSKVLDLAIHGKLVPQDPNDEPAIELLRRINPHFKPCDTSHYENLPEGWASVMLLDICKIDTGKWDANHASINGKYRFYTCSAQFSYSDTKRFSGECLIIPGNGDIGQVYYYDGDFDAYQRTYVLSHILIYSKYLYYHLLSNWRNVNTDKQFGSTIKFVRIGNFQNYIVLLPPLSEQKRIVERIETIFAQLDTITAEL